MVIESWESTHAIKRWHCTAVVQDWKSDYIIRLIRYVTSIKHKLSTWYWCRWCRETGKSVVTPCKQIPAVDTSIITLIIGFRLIISITVWYSIWQMMTSNCLANQVAYIFPARRPDPKSELGAEFIIRASNQGRHWRLLLMQWANGDPHHQPGGRVLPHGRKIRVCSMQCSMKIWSCEGFICCWRDGQDWGV